MVIIILQSSLGFYRIYIVLSFRRFVFVGEKSLSIGDYFQRIAEVINLRSSFLAKTLSTTKGILTAKTLCPSLGRSPLNKAKRNDQRAAELLSLMSVLDRQAIPKSLLSSDIEEVKLEIALGAQKRSP